MSDSSVATGEAAGELSIVANVRSYGGFIGQFYDLTSGFGVTAIPLSIDEDGTRQLLPFHLLDDGIGLAFEATDVSWSI